MSVRLLTCASTSVSLPHHGAEGTVCSIKGSGVRQDRAPGQDKLQERMAVAGAHELMG